MKNYIICKAYILKKTCNINNCSYLKDSSSYVQVIAKYNWLEKGVNCKESAPFYIVNYLVIILFFTYIYCTDFKKKNVSDIVYLLHNIYFMAGGRRED